MGEIVTAPNLRVVADPPEAVDLYANWKADIAARDWSAMHVAADKRRPIDLPDAPKRAWRR